MKDFIITTFFLFVLLHSISGQEIKSIDLPLIHGNEFIRAGHPMRNIQFIVEGGEQFLYISSMFNIRTIYIYKIHREGPKYFKKIVIEKEGPNAVKGSIVGVFVMNSDEIYIEVGQGSSYIVNGNGERLKYRADSRSWEEGAMLDAFAFIAPPNPGYVIGKKVLFTSCMTEGWNLRNIGFLLDMKSLESESLIDIKKLNTNWYGSSAPMIMHYFCAMGNSIYLSLPYDHNIYKFNEEKNIIDRIDAKSSLLGTIRPVAKEKTEMSDFRAYEHAAINGFYGPVMYNSHTSNFYRYVYAPVKTYNKEKDAFKNRFVEIYDSDWNLVHQFKIPEKYRGDNVFAGPDGLCFLDYDKAKRIEDVMTFDCYKF